MAEESNHEEGTQLGKFCALRKPPCGCSENNNYQTNCKPSGWKRGLWPGARISYEAHHCLCVASVNSQIVSNEKCDISPVVRETQWCVNNKDNMLAMPLFAHTIAYYCKADMNVAEKLLKKGAKLDEAIDVEKEAPEFENIPMHDIDHMGKLGYKDYEVDEYLKLVAALIEQSKEKHKKKVEELKGELNDAAEYFKNELNRRGNREEGTHECWRKGMEGKSDWYRPFSMAMDGHETKRSFPYTSKSRWSVARKLAALVRKYTEGRILK